MFSPAQYFETGVAAPPAAPAQAVNPTADPIIWFLQTFVTLFIIMNVVLVTMAYQTWAERKVIARMQLRYGPNRAGHFGLLQPMADMVKMFTKEFIVPREADRPVFLVAPLLSFIPAVAAFAIVPWGDARSEGLLGGWIRPAVANLNVGILYMLALSSVGVYGIIMA